MGKCLHSSVTAMPAAACAQPPFWGGGLSIGLKIFPPNILGRNLKLPTEILSSANISKPQINHFGLCSKK